MSARDYQMFLNVLVTNTSYIVTDILKNLNYLEGNFLMNLFLPDLTTHAFNLLWYYGKNTTPIIIISSVSIFCFLTSQM
jgi:hypothetical protein